MPHHPAPKKQFIFRLLPVLSGLLVLGERASGSYMAWRLRTVHPNPGPIGRDKSDAAKAVRRERRKGRRVEKRKNKEEEKARKEAAAAAAAAEVSQHRKELVIVTWNVQRMSLGTRNKVKARAVAEYARKCKWDVVLLSEVRADGEGVVWMGKEEESVVIVHSKRAAVLMRGEVLKAWSEEGMRKKISDRHVSVKVRGMALTATYLPVRVHGNADEVEEEMEILAEHANWAKSDEVLVIGGDFNAHVGAGEERGGVCGKFGMRCANDAGKDLLGWCESNGLSYVNSFFRHKNRGTWFSNIHKRWYELDGFLMRKEERAKYTRKLNTVGEASISDHKPKKLKLELRRKSWRKVYQGKKTPRLNWEKLRDEEVARNFHREMEEEMTAGQQVARRQDTTEWTQLAEKVLKIVERVCGRQVKSVENPWMVGKEEEVDQMRRRISGAVERRNEVVRQGGSDVEKEAARVEVQEARKAWKKQTAEWEKRWWETVADECVDAQGKGDTGGLYRGLRKMGLRDMKKAPTDTSITTDGFRKQFSKVSEERFENPPEEIDEAVDKAEDLRGSDQAKEWEERLNKVPDFEEVVEQMKLMRDSAPGEDGIRLSYLLKGGRKVLEEVVAVIQHMFLNGADSWEEALRVGIVVPLFKKGDRNEPGNYRGVCLLSLGSRILARVLACRLQKWAESVKVLDDDQQGFRKGRSTVDATQMMVRLQEDQEDLWKRTGGEEVDEGDQLTGRLLDLKKAYPRINKPALWRLLERYGISGNFLRAIKDLHESTTYKVRGKEGMSEEWIPARGLREGCPSSPILFNIYHQAVMRVAKVEREKAAVASGRVAGVVMKYVPGSAFPHEGSWEKDNSEAIEVKIDKNLFADDTTILGNKSEIDEGVEKVKEVMGWYEERNNDDKEEVLDFGKDGTGKVRMLGSWMGWKADIDERLKRSYKAWWMTKKRLKSAKIPKKVQARIIEASVESSLLFDCQARTWRVKEIKRLQSYIDKAYRYVWSNKSKPPLRQMQEEGKRMEDVRKELGVRSLRWKIEKRVLERIGHVMRMEEGRMVKAVVLGWVKGLEKWVKKPGAKRKTVLYWKKLLREAGIDASRIGQLTKDRKAWKARVKQRMDHLALWEESRGKRYQGPELARNQPKEREVIFECEVCGKVCKNKGGLTIHRKRMHEASSLKKAFPCELCGQVFKQEANRFNHAKVCEGPGNQHLRKCLFCGSLINKKSLKQHERDCSTVRSNALAVTPPPAARKYKAKWKPCRFCGETKSASNMSRHEKLCQDGGAGL